MLNAQMVPLQLRAMCVCARGGKRSHSTMEN